MKYSNRGCTVKAVVTTVRFTGRPTAGYFSAVWIKEGIHSAVSVKSSPVKTSRNGHNRTKDTLRR